MGQTLANCCNPDKLNPQPAIRRELTGDREREVIPVDQNFQADPTKPKKISKNDFVFIGELGKGGFGKVSLVKKKDTGMLYALKEIKKSLLMDHRQDGQKISTDDILNEKNIMKDSNSLFVVKLHSCFQDKFNIYFLMELVKGGNLFGFLKEKRTFSEDVARFYSAEVVLALEYLHEEMKVIYRDLKPENILVGEDGHIKLSDFGLSKIGFSYKGSIKGTPDFIAPEVFKNETFSKMVDYWSLGCLVYEMIYGQPVFQASTIEARTRKILSADYKFPENVKVSEDAKNLIRKLWKVDVTQRLGSRGIDEIKGDPFYRSIDWNDLSKKKLTPPITNINMKINKLSNNEAPEETEFNLPGFTYTTEALNKDRSPNTLN